MSSIFLKFLNMSITASWLILAVILVRLLLKKAPKWIPCILWGLVAVRLICPFSLESVFSLIPSSETIPSNIALQNEPHINSGITVINEAVNPVITESFAPALDTSVNPLQVIIPIAAAVWIAGIVIMLAYALVSYLKLKKTVSVCVPIKEGILSCDEVKAPFILGVLRPVIYVPSSMQGETLDYVLRHETAHLQRRDHWWKPLGFLLLSVYWFNPLCWIAYILLCRDIEMACDEKVIRDMDKGDMAAYSQALLDCSFPRKRIAACPLAFGEVGVKERVKGVLNYKKPAFWIILIAVIACIVLAICLMTNPSSSKSLSEKLGASMDKAISERYHRYEAERFYATWDYDVLRVSESANRTTVYAWVMYEEYSFDGRDVKEESGSHIPTVITFDTPSDGGLKSFYDVIEYWEPRDGSYFSEDIRSKFPLSIRAKAFDVSGADRQHENCLKAAREYYGVGQNTTDVDFNIRYELGDTAHDFTSTPFGARAGDEVEIKTEVLIDADIHVYVDGQEIGKTHYDSDYWGYSFIMPDKDVLVTARFYTKDEIWGTETVDLAALREKYPDYFDLGTFKGLEVYVWQMAPGSYSCGVMLGTNRNKTLEELMNLKGATLAEMRAILSTYDIDEEDIFVIPWQNPISSYIADYWISQKDEDPASVERRKQEYIDGIRQRLFGAEQNDEYDPTEGRVDGSGSVTVDIRIDVCELYLEVLEDLWNVDSGLNSEISQIGIDLSELSHLTELEKGTVMREFASKHNLPFIAGTWEELCEQGYIDKDNLYWEDGLFFSIKTNKDGDSDPERTAFDAQKWRSVLGAYFFGQCTAQKNANGKWSYTVGQEAIS